MENNEMLEPIATEEPTTTEEPIATEAPITMEEPQAQQSSPDAYYDVIYTAVNDALIAQTVTDGQSVSNVALEYFKGVLLNQSPFTDYVVYVGEPYQYWWGNNQQIAYEYCLAYGDLDINGTTFTGLADIVTMRTTGENSVVYMNDQYISVDAPLYYSRSNLGDYSGIVTKDFSGIAILLTLALGGAVWLVKSFLSPKS